ncbi:unnamed protein product [marine sediment metagenome]|uniref:Uncharacterized protein n=1 Tax=marine sediment metagenome TaxID=412755 RepID=X1AP32_9ZZZZ
MYPSGLRDSSAKRVFIGSNPITHSNIGDDILFYRSTPSMQVWYRGYYVALPMRRREFDSLYLLDFNSPEFGEIKTPTFGA